MTHSFIHCNILFVLGLVSIIIIITTAACDDGLFFSFSFFPPQQPNTIQIDRYLNSPSRGQGEREKRGESC